MINESKMIMLLGVGMNLGNQFVVRNCNIINLIKESEISINMFMEVGIV